MIEAGIAVLMSSGIRDAYLKADRYTVAEIFRAMHLAREQATARSQSD
jgi:hypothetical protein